MVVRYSPQAEPLGDAGWTAIGDWYTQLALPRAQVTPELAAKAQALTAGQSDFTAKIQSIANYLQRNIRYVGIEIGIGGLQPHSASDVFHYQYGDCKDKATLLRAMLEPVGVHVAWVAVDTHRGIVDPQLPSLRGNHMIAAIEIPAGYTNPELQAVVTAGNGKRYLIFDPTDEWTPVGQIRPELQGGYGILSEGAQSQLIQLPRLTPQEDRTEHVVHAQLLADGSLEGAVVEQRFGHAANASRITFAEGSQQQQREFLEKRLGQDLRGVTLDKIAAPHPTDLAHPFEIDYSFHAPGYARPAGEMLLVRPRVMGTDTLPLPRGSRNWPIELGAIQTRRDQIDLTLPPGYVVDELPTAVTLDTDFASYHSSVTAEGATLHYTREYTVKQLQLEASRYEELRKFHERIAYDEATTAVLKKQ
jgi:Transglutaminase-like superfamily